MSVTILTVLLFASMLAVIVTGIPLAFGLGAIAVSFTWWQWGTRGLYMIGSQTLGLMNSQSLIAVPMFILMGYMLEKSGIADALYEMMYRWIGRLAGGLAAGTVVICTLFAAMTGLSGAATISMGLIALPAMLKRKYDKGIAIGAIAAGGALGILIPPSVTMVVYALVAQESIGKLFIGGIGPGLVLSSLFIIYILVRCRLQPQLGPPLPKEEAPTWRDKFQSLKAVFLPLMVIFLVLGTIFAGVATVIEASILGAVGSILAALANKRLTRQLLQEVSHKTIVLTGMVAWISIGAMTFATIYSYMGGKEFVSDLLTNLGIGRWGVMIVIQLILFVLGMFLDIWGIIMITVPVFVPVVTHLGFNPVWFGVLFVVNMEMAYITPPYGFNLFYMKGVVPKGISLTDIYRSVVPFIGVQALCLALVMIFPQIILWLPDRMFAK